MSFFRTNQYVPRYGDQRNLVADFNPVVRPIASGLPFDGLRRSPSSPVTSLPSWGRPASREPRQSRRRRPQSGLRAGAFWHLRVFPTCHSLPQAYLDTVNYPDYKYSIAVQALLPIDPDVLLTGASLSVPLEAVKNARPRDRVPATESYNINPPAKPRYPRNRAGTMLTKTPMLRFYRRGAGEADGYAARFYRVI